MQTVISLIAAAGIATASPAAAEVVPLTPQGKWAVDYGLTSCLATRSYGDPKTPVVLGFRPSLNDSTIRLILVQNDGYLEPRHAPVTVAGLKTTGLRYSMKGTKRRVTWIDLSRTDFDLAVSGKSLRIVGEGVNVDLTLVGMASVSKALQTCNTDLRAYWNADEAGLTRIATQAKPLMSPAKFVTSEDYPAQALRESKGGRTRVSLLIDDQGTAKDCVVEEHSGVATIDAQTCIMILKRGKFAPAQDGAGKPVKSHLSYSFNWKIG
jgi:TonB family protein